MDSTDVFDKFNKIIEGQLPQNDAAKPKPGDKSQTTTTTKDSTQKGEENAKTSQNAKKDTAAGSGYENYVAKEDTLGDEEDQITEWIPELKRLVQFPDMRRNIQVIPLEEFAQKKNKKIRTMKEIDHRWREYAFVLRRILDSDYNFHAYRLELRSNNLRRIFRKMARPYSELNLEANPILIPFPFRCLFHLREEIKGLAESDETSETAKLELQELLSFIYQEPALIRLIKPYDDLVSRGKITLELHWALFRPHEWVYSEGYNDPSTEYANDMCVFSTGIEQRAIGPDSSDNSSHNLCYVSTSHNGLKFGLVEGKWAFGKRSKEVVDISIKDLGIVPMRLLPKEEQDEIRSRLIERGKKYCELSSTTHTLKQYHGPIALSAKENAKLLGGLIEDDSQFNMNWTTSQRVVIDRAAEKEMWEFREEDKLIAPCLREYLGEPTQSADPDDVPSDDDDILIGLGDGEDSTGSDLDADEVARKRKEKERKLKMVWDDHQLSDDDHLMCPPTIIAFLLIEKAWAWNIYICGLKDIDWKDDPFVSLQLPQDKKHLVRSLVQGFSAESDDEDDDHYEDIIEGKGKGLIFLLHGPPGLGKTLTAESVAESTHRPLYHVSTGELSTEVAKLEKQLSDIFRLGLRWGAVVLLDEADVLMARRTTTELTRNSIVAVFLRLIEYYSGMLFLTTNRFEDFDNAFYNRIHVTIRYTSLEAPERTNIWRQHLVRASRRNKRKRAIKDGRADTASANWSEKAYELLGQVETNGRDIRNYTRTAYGYARALGEELRIDHVITVIQNNVGVEHWSKILEELKVLGERLKEDAETRRQAEDVEKDDKQKGEAEPASL